MAVFDVDRLLANWATAWSSCDPNKVLELVTDDCVYEDVTFGVVTHIKKAHR
jgi:ketosteroid isomerase-like protein